MAATASKLGGRNKKKQKTDEVSWFACGKELTVG